MTAHSERQAAAASHAPVRLSLLLTALIFVGFNLRTVLLEVPPILPQIKSDLGLSYTATGFLNALPPLLLGLAAYPSALLIGRLGSRRAVTISLALMSVMALARAFAITAPAFFAATALLSLAIALGQTTTPMVVREWFGGHIGQTTAAYSTGLMIGEVVAATLTTPLLLSTLAGNSWRGTFIFWAIPVVAALVLWLVAMPRRERAAQHFAAHIESSPIVTKRAKPWRIIQASLILGSGSLLFFGMDTWVPVYYQHIGRTDIPAALAVLTIAQLPASLALTAWGRHFAGKPLGFIVAGTAAVTAMIAWFFVPESWYLVLIGIVGAASASIFVLGLSLPAMLASGGEVARVSGIVLGVSYTMSFLGPFLGGALWDATGIAITAFIPILGGAVAVLALGAFMPDVS